MSSISQTCWQQTLAQLRSTEPAHIRAWMHDLEAPVLVNGILKIKGRNDAQVQQLQRSSLAIARCAQAALDRLVSVEVELGEASPAPAPAVEVPQLRPDFTFESFAVGPENQLAYAAVRRAAEDCECPFNPLYVHGPAGSGKKHLLQAFCHGRIAQGAPEVCFVRAPDFVSRFTESFESGFAREFRSEFGKAEALAIDDLDYFQDKPRAQEELFHVTNSILGRGKQLLVSGTRPAGALPGLQERLVSRIRGGLEVAVDGPSEETKLRILQQKNQAGCFDLSGPVLQRIAKRCDPSALDDILLRINDLAQVYGGKVTADLVDEYFRSPHEPAPA